MTSLLKSAHVVHDVDENKTFIEIMYSKYVPDEGYKTFVDYLNAQPIGDWTKIVSKKETVRYEKFLDTMIEKNLETRQKMALIMLENITGDMFIDIKTQIRIMNTIKILDPTFDPPFVNRRCSWQKQFVRDFCKDILPDVVERCTNEKRLDRFFSVLRLIELEL
jgi:hypothetical protein